MQGGRVFIPHVSLLHKGLEKASEALDDAVGKALQELLSTNPTALSKSLDFFPFS